MPPRFAHCVVRTGIEPILQYSGALAVLYLQRSAAGGEWSRATPRDSGRLLARVEGGGDAATVGDVWKDPQG